MKSIAKYSERLNVFQSRPEWLAEAQELLRMAPEVDDASVLDFGCGLGRMSEVVQAAGGEYLGVDISVHLVTQARVMYPTAHFKPLSPTFFPMHRVEFDIVILNHVIAHVHDPLLALVALRRSLKPGGTILIANPNWWNWFLRMPANIARGYRSDPTAAHDFTRRTLHDLLERAGFAEVEVKYAGAPALLGMAPSRLLAVGRA